jgi:hypothetical protein
MRLTGQSGANVFGTSSNYVLLNPTSTGLYLILIHQQLIQTVLKLGTLTMSMLRSLLQ